MVETLERRNRKHLIVKLTNARNEIDEALAVPTARYDPVLLTSTSKTELGICRDVLQRTIRKLQEEQ